MCSKHNEPESCAYKACTVEGSFVIRIFDFVFMDGLTIDKKFSHENGFSPDEECIVRDPGHDHDHIHTFREVTEVTTTTARNREFRMVNNPVLQANHFEKQCCGEYPQRYPYKPLKGFHDCCNGKIFETVEKECCLDGSVKKIGMCGEVYVDTGSADYDMLAFYEDADSLQIQGF